MTFVSFEWLAWMGAVTLLFWMVPERFRLRFLIAASILFLAVKDPLSCAILAALTATTHLLTNRPEFRGSQAVVAVLPVAAILLAYKLWSAASGDDLLTSTIIPLGLSYYALRCIHYVLERYKGNIDSRPFLDLISYLFFLPTIYIGPIHRFAQFDRDARRHRWDAAVFSEGLERILYGYVKIVVLGNFLVSQAFADWSASVATDASPAGLYLRMTEIGLNLYFQFSGFSDISIGFARLLGFRVMENFNWPFFQKNLSEFWRCWHISLTSWCREYVYASVIAHTRSPALGALATLIVIALWHEVSIRYLIWGFYHGLGIIAWQQSQKLWSGRPPIQSLALRRSLDFLSILLTLHYVWLGFLLVRQPDLNSMAAVLHTLFLGWI